VPGDSVETVRDRSTWTELFYDLVMVFALTQAAGILAEHPGWASLGRSLLILAPLWWCWIGLTLLVNSVAETTGQRLFILGLAVVMLTAAVAAPRAFSSRADALMYSMAYLVTRLALGEAMRRKGAFPTNVNPYTISTACGLVFVAGALLPNGPREAVWALAAVTQLIGPAVLGRRLRGLHFGPAHLAERYATLIIIALGESVVTAAAVAARAPLAPGPLLAMVLAAVLGADLWWTYFHFGASAIEHALRTHRTQALVVRDVLTYGHFALLAGLLVAAVGARQAVAQPAVTGGAFAACLLPAGTAVFALTTAFTRWRMFGAASWTRVGPGILLLVTCLAAPALPRLAVLAVVVAIITALNLTEYWIISTGRPPPLIQRRSPARRPGVT
jgi:low temperature requirement protein LtrA